jgi:hypothetical protein
MNTIKKMVLTAGVIGVCLTGGQAFAVEYGYGPGTGDCLSAFQYDIDHLQAARSGNVGNGSGRKGPGDGTGNGGSGPKDGSGNGNKTGDCPTS